MPGLRCPKDHQCDPTPTNKYLLSTHIPCYMGKAQSLQEGPLLSSGRRKACVCKAMITLGSKSEIETMGAERVLRCLDGGGGA